MEITIYNCETGETIVRPMNQKELDEYEARQFKFEAELISLAEKEQAKNALLKKLGITADEAKLLLS